jgi:uncharacterized protein (UPF0297 family)
MKLKLIKTISIVLIVLSSLSIKGISESQSLDEILTAACVTTINRQYRSEGFNQAVSGVIDPNQTYGQHEDMVDHIRSLERERIKELINKQPLHIKINAYNNLSVDDKQQIIPELMDGLMNCLQGGDSFPLAHHLDVLAYLASRGESKAGFRNFADKYGKEKNSLSAFKVGLMLSGLQNELKKDKVGEKIIKEMDRKYNLSQIKILLMLKDKLQQDSSCPSAE